MTTQQPEWELVGTIGDVDPLGCGGGFVFRDTTGVYRPELEYVEPWSDGDDVQSVTVYRVALESHTYANGVLSDNKFHPDKEVWYGAELDRACESCGCDPDYTRQSLCGENAWHKALAYEMLASYFGWQEFDSYPLTITPAEAEARYAAPKYQSKRG